MNNSFIKYHIFLFFSCVLLVASACSRAENRDPLQDTQNPIRSETRPLSAPEADIALSAGKDPPAPDTLPNAGKSFKPALSLQTDRLFDFPVFDENRRFKRLEDEVQKISDNLNEIIPIINSQIQNKEKLENVLEKLNKLAIQAETQGLNIRGPPRGNPDPEPPDKAALVEIHNMRMAEYPDKLRIVFDCSARPDFTKEIAGNAASLTFKNVYLAENIKDKRFKNYHLKGNPDFKNDGDAGLTTSLALNSIAQNIETILLNPDKNNDQFRVVFDIYFTPKTRKDELM